MEQVVQSAQIKIKITVFFVRLLSNLISHVYGGHFFFIIDHVIIAIFNTDWAVNLDLVASIAHT